MMMLGALLLAAIPAPAQADGFIVPFVGANFGGESGQELGRAIDANRFNWGASFAFMGGGVFGAEADVGYSPDFFGKSDLGGSGVLTLMGNFLLGIPFGGQQGFGVRPYGLAGIGLIRPEVEAFGDLLSGDQNKFGWNFGGGVMILFATHVGVRADVRYFRSFSDLALDLIDVDLGESDLDFARGSLGLILRF
jgi:opacity protein-like surface antigen